MAEAKPWLLPDGVDELLPPEARALEQLRRRLLDVLESWGYELVIPPIVEYLDSLLSGIGEDLDLQTFKLTDQVSGRSLGVRADITPQVARIDAHRLTSAGPQRLCYVGPVVHTRPDKFAGSRNPLQLGAELYGHDGIASDLEVIALLVEILNVAGIPDITLEIGHMGLFHAICESAAFDRAFESQVLTHLLMKDSAGLRDLLSEAKVSAAVMHNLLALTRLNGDASVLVEARASFSDAAPAVSAALEQLCALNSALAERDLGVALHFDLAELRGYRYHTGIMFAAYTPVVGRAIAFGGRYDNIGASFGRARSATGFSVDVKTLVLHSEINSKHLSKIFAPAGNAPDLLEAIRTYRAQGYVVIQGLPGQTVSAADQGCSLEMHQRRGEWSLDDVE